MQDNITQFRWQKEVAEDLRRKREWLQELEQTGERKERVNELLEDIGRELEVLEVVKVGEEALEKECIQKHGLHRLQLRACKQHEEAVQE